MWDLLRGAAQLKQPPPAELGRRYAEMLSENIGQPGFRELLVAVHDADAHRDLIFTLVSEARRRDLIRRPTSALADARRAEVFDLSGVARDHLPDAVAAALSIALGDRLALGHLRRRRLLARRDAPSLRSARRPHPADRRVDRPGRRAGPLVSAAPELPGPHALPHARIDGHGRLGEYLQSSEAAIVRDATTTTAGVRIFNVRPAHNPVGPFDFAGGYDERSQRRQGLGELMNRGYEDAYHQFIEPVVGASGERVGDLDRRASL
jgi:hypothetical protein